MRLRRGWWRVGQGGGIVLAAVLAVGGCMAQTPGGAPQAGPASAKNSGSTTEALNATLNSAPSLSGSETTTAIPLKITMTPSETPLKIGSTSNVAATIENISNVPVAIPTSSLMLTAPAIVGGTASKCVLDILEANVLIANQPWITLQPQDTVTVLFNLSQPLRTSRPEKTPGETDAAFEMEKKNFDNYSRSCGMGSLGPVERLLDFSPGNYDYYLQGQFTLCTTSQQATSNPACQLPNRNFSASASFPVGIDQMSIVIFSVLGGWLALLYVIFSRASQPGSILHDFNAALLELAPEEKSKNPLGRFVQKLMTSSGARAMGRFLIRLVASAILSAAVTVISSRISNPSLPIRISVLDSWGAMTMGFLSYFIGAKFISSLTDWSGGATTTPPSTPASAPLSASAPPVANAQAAALADAPKHS